MECSHCLAGHEWDRCRVQLGLSRGSPISRRSSSPELFPVDRTQSRHQSNRQRAKRAPCVSHPGHKASDWQAWLQFAPCTSPLMVDFSSRDNLEMVPGPGMIQQVGARDEEEDLATIGKKRLITAPAAIGRDSTPQHCLPSAASARDDLHLRVANRRHREMPWRSTAE